VTAITAIVVAYRPGQRLEPCVDAILARKYELLERNRWLTITTLYSGRTLFLLAPVLLATEALLLVAATARGWLPAKLAGYRWLCTHLGLIGSRRKATQRQRLRSDRDLAGLLAARFTPTNIGPLAGLAVSTPCWPGTGLPSGDSSESSHLGDLP
jgi:hypothetical protein